MAAGIGTAAAALEHRFEHLDAAGQMADRKRISPAKTRFLV
jgi:hypothetical protein